MSVTFKVNAAKFKEQLNATAAKMHAATRPAAQAGAQIVYDRARAIVAAELTSKKEHWFYGTAAKKRPKGQKKAFAYLFQPGTLHDAIYQVFSKANSFADVSTYHVSWNHTAAPYGHMVEFGTSKTPSHSFIGRAGQETKSSVLKAVKERFIAEIKK